MLLVYHYWPHKKGRGTYVLGRNLQPMPVYVGGVDFDQLKIRSCENVE
jgi:hypothetical protein